MKKKVSDHAEGSGSLMNAFLQMWEGRARACSDSTWESGFVRGQGAGGRGRGRAKWNTDARTGRIRPSLI